MANFKLSYLLRGGMLAVLLPACVAGCSGGGEAPVAAASGSATPTAAGSTAAPEPSASPRAEDAPEYGPTSVRVLTAKASAPETALFEVVGPAGAKYGFRAPDGKVAACNQVDGAADAHALPGLPPNAVQHVSVTCEQAGKTAPAGTLLVKVDLKTFVYDFEVPAKPAT
ncbi:hypothetical protein AB0K00_48325 [Dactylosporangium sp. NPDC049525]|uniref:hypothetical protein n=1 Tax=Dactylosporangium sp. NPDC049525 TaxID=3154730 RepID=UPI0034186F1F